MPPQRRKYTTSANYDPQFTEEMDTNGKRNQAKRVKNVHSSRRSSKTSSNSDPNYSDSVSFSQKKCIAWFNEYVVPDDPEMIGPEGIERFCKDLMIDPEDISMLVLAWKMDAKQMGFFTLAEWLKGLSELQCDSLHKLRSKLDFLRSLLNDASIFKSVYRYSFDFAKDKDQRNMDIETAKAMLQLLLAKQWSLHHHFQLFLEQSKYKVLNKDQWCNIIEFSRSISTDLRNYDEDGAWPVLLDEFVEWYKREVLQQPPPQSHHRYN